MAGSSNALRLSGPEFRLRHRSDRQSLNRQYTTENQHTTKKGIKAQAQQEAYREIIGKFQAFQNKYLDILNSASYLKEPQHL